MRVGRLASWLVLGTTFTLASCKGTPDGTLTLVTGGEADALTRAPTPTELVVERIAIDGTTTEMARTALPTTGLALGEFGTDEVGAIGVRALDAAGTTLVSGRTLLMLFGSLEQVPVSVFVSRHGEFARMPGPLARAVDTPVIDFVLDQFLVLADGTSTQLYDVSALGPRAATPTLPRPARSLVAFTTTLVAIDESGASTFDLLSSQSADVAPPDGGTFAEVAGGKTIPVPDGSAYVVGATRASGGATTRVLRLSAEGVISFASLSTPREGACAAWLPGRGLVVVGGSETGAGAELLPADATVATSLPFPADAVRGCGAAPLDASRIVVAGGAEGPPRVLDLACAGSCEAVPIASSVPIVRADVVRLADGVVLIGGDDAARNSRVFRATPADVREIPLRVARQGARLVPMSTGGAAIVGGALEIEQYRE